MALTLEDLGYTFDDSSLNGIETEVNEGIIKPTTTFVDTPVLINDFLKELVADLKTLFETNLQNLASDFDDWFTQKAIDLKAEIEQSLSLDPDTLYDIYVTRAQKAEDSDKFNGKTYSEVISDIYTNYISTATVSNSLKFNGKTMDEYDNYIKNTLKPYASDTEKAFGYTYDELKSNILAEVSTTGGGVDLETVQLKVENEWTAFKAQDSDKYAGYALDDFKTNIIKTVKVDNAVNADTLGGVDYDTLITSLNTMIDNYITNAISSENDNLINLIKNTKVLSAYQADEAINALHFDNQDATYWKETIIPAIKVDNAVHADDSDKLGGIDSAGWQSKIDNMETTIKTNVETSWIAYKAQTVETINGIAVENFDDHISQMIQDALDDINTYEINATKFDGYTADEWKTDIIPTITVDNANHALSSDSATNAATATHSKYWLLDPDNPDTSPSYSVSSYLDYLRNNFKKIVNGYSFYINNTYPFEESIFDNYFNLLYIYLTKDSQYLNKEENDTINTYTMNTFSLDMIFKNYTRKEFIYDSDNKLTNINYYKNYYYTDADGNDVVEEKLIKEDIYEYDDSKLLSITEKIHSYVWRPDNYTVEQFTDNTYWYNVIFQKTITFTYDTLENITEENITYKILYKNVDDTDYTEEELL